MFTFVSKDPHHEIAHPSLAEAAGSPYFTLRFHPTDKGHGQFTTDNEKLANALDDLIEDDKVRGVMMLGAPGLAATVPIAFDDLAAKLAELTKPAEGEAPPVPPTLAQLAEAFELGEDALKASLAELVKATPEAAEALKAAGIAYETPEVPANGNSTSRRGQRR